MIRKFKDYKITENKALKIGLALGSGGARGIAHIEFLKIFDELGIKPHMITGCSMGSLIGGLYASGASAVDIEKYFSSLSLRDIQKLTDIVMHKSGFIKGDKAVAEMKKRIKSKTFKSLKIPLKVVATDFYDGDEYVFSKGDLFKAIRASCSIPGVFIPVKYKNKLLVDGGIVNPVPYDLLMKNCDYIIAIDVAEGTFSKTRKEHKKKQINPSVHEIIYSTYEIVQLNIINSMIKINPPHLFIKPPVSNFNMMEFHRGKEILELAKPDAKKFKSILKKIINN